MIINLNPVSGTNDTTISLNNLILTINGIDYDLSVIPAGGQADAPVSSPLQGIVTRDEVTILYTYDQSSAELNQPYNPSDYTFTVTSGLVPDPIVRRV